LLTIKSTENGKQKDIKIEFDGQDTFYVPISVPVQSAAPPGTQAAEAVEVAELGAMRFTRMR
jgi:hypothetical protein